MASRRTPSSRSTSRSASACPDRSGARRAATRSGACRSRRCDRAGSGAASPCGVAYPRPVSAARNAVRPRPAAAPRTASPARARSSRRPVPPWFSATCLHDRQAEPGPARLARPGAVDPVEAFEDPGEVAARDPEAGVDDREDDLAVVRRELDVRPRRPAACSGSRCRPGCARAAPGRARSRGRAGRRRRRSRARRPASAAGSSNRSPSSRTIASSATDSSSSLPDSSRDRSSRSATIRDSRAASRSSCAANRGIAEGSSAGRRPDRLGGGLDRGRRRLQLVRGVGDEVAADLVEPPGLGDVADHQHDRAVVASGAANPRSTACGRAGLDLDRQDGRPPAARSRRGVWSPSGSRASTPGPAGPR